MGYFNEKFYVILIIILATIFSVVILKQNKTIQKLEKENADYRYICTLHDKICEKYNK